MIKNKIYYTIIIFCTLTSTNLIPSPNDSTGPKKEIMSRLRPISGKEWALCCACTGCFFGAVSQAFSGYNYGPCDGIMVASACGQVLFPVTLKAIDFYQSKYHKNTLKNS